MKLNGHREARLERIDAFRSEGFKEPERVKLIRVVPYVLKHERGN